MSLVSILTTYGQIGVDTLRDAVAPLNATRKTLESIRFEIRGLNLLFYAREFFRLLESGRRPTSKNPSPEMIQNLTEYAKARGMDKPRSAAWAIAKKINKEGDRTKRSGGRNVYSDVVATFTKELTDELAKDWGKTVIMEVKDQFKK